MAVPPFTIVGCGIIEKELRFLADKNGWPATFDLLPAALHNDLDELARRLVEALDRHTGQKVLVYYGWCHPRIDELVDRPGVVRIARENCIASLIGDDAYHAQQMEGTYFLVEQWARGWDEAIRQTFGDHPGAVREIFTDAHTRMVAFATPLSGDYSEQAREAARQAGLPLTWRAAGLARLEEALAEGIARFSDCPP